MVFDPVVNGRTLHFHRRGSYDGLMLIWDEETNTYWQHITGQALYGGSVGTKLNMIATTRQITAAEAIAQNPAARWYSTAINPDQTRHLRHMHIMNTQPQRIEQLITQTISIEDARRPRFELGLGIWNGQRSIIFPLTLLHMTDNALITTFGGR